MPRDVEDPAIAAVSRTSVRDVKRSSVATRQGEEKSWRFSGPASWGWPSIALRLSPPPCCYPLPDVSGEPSRRCRPIVRRQLCIVNRRPTEGGKRLAILRPGVMGLTVRRAPPFAPPPLLPSASHHPTFLASHLRAVDRLSGGGCGGARTARNGVGGPMPIPPPRRAPRRSDSDHAKCDG